VVAVTVSPNTAKALTSFSFASPAAAGTINETAKTVAVTVPYGTNVTALIATFVTTGASVKVGSTAQASGTTPNNFSSPEFYTVTAADGSTQDYVVTVTIAPYVFTVTFDGQGATVGPSPATKTVAAPATTVGTLPTDPQRDNFRFDGWYTGTNGSGTVFTGSTTVTQTMTVYAKWTPVFIVTYNANGGAGTAPVDANKYQNGSTVTVLSGSTLSRTNYTFAGWNTQADTLGTSYLAASTFAMGSANVNLYAKWRMNAPVVTTHPANKNCPVNDSVTFTIVASGDSLHYQWQKNGGNIAGATAASYTTPALTVADTLASTYRCVVSNFGGNAPSNGATLSISTLGDFDGNLYHQVKIGNQVWTMENLRSTHYNDGTGGMIWLDTSNSSWSGITTPMCCYFAKTSNVDSIKKFGLLYNWYVVSPTNPNKVAPSGWHVPSDAEWDTLKNYLIANGYNWDGTTAGEKYAKSMAAKTDWDPSATVGTPGNDMATNNRSGFSALPVWYRSNGSDPGSIGRCSWFWTTAEYNSTYAWIRNLTYSVNYLYSDYRNKSTCLSIRLIKN
jgi:uncharacterized protein (TIGR02145 family)/uncharacterized repeat protein (TIGR02543 family)